MELDRPREVAGLDLGVHGAAAQAGEEAHVINAQQALAVSTWRLSRGRVCGGLGWSGKRFWHVPMVLWGQAKAKKLALWLAQSQCMMHCPKHVLARSKLAHGLLRRSLTLLFLVFKSLYVCCCSELG